MKQKDSPPSASSGEDDFSEPVGSLLELVEPELKSLSKYWLGALKDHALLALPGEYVSQLPPQGGMFYRSDRFDPEWLTNFTFLPCNKAFIYMVMAELRRPKGPGSQAPYL